MTGVLIRGGNLDTQRETPDTCTQRQPHERTARCSHMLGKERDLRRNHTSQHLDLGLVVFRTARK